MENIVKILAQIVLELEVEIVILALDNVYKVVKMDFSETLARKPVIPDVRIKSVSIP